MKVYGKIYEHDQYTSIDVLYGHEVITLLDDITRIVNHYNPTTKKLDHHIKHRSCNISASKHTDYFIVETETFPFPLYTLIALPGPWTIEFLPCNSPDTTLQLPQEAGLSRREGHTG